MMDIESTSLSAEEGSGQKLAVGGRQQPEGTVQVADVDTSEPEISPLPSSSSKRDATEAILSPSADVGSSRPRGADREPRRPVDADEDGGPASLLSLADALHDHVASFVETDDLLMASASSQELLRLYRLGRHSLTVSWPIWPRQIKIGQVACVNEPNHPALESLLLAQMRLSTLTIADRFLRKKALELLDRVLQQRHARNNPPLQGLSVSGWYEYELSCERVQELLLSAPLARLQHLSIGVDAEQKYVPAVVSYLERGAPLLESLQITCRDPWQRKDTDFLLDWSPVAVELAQGKAPSLTSLSIRGMDLHDHDACIRLGDYTRTGAWKGMRSLSLTGPSYRFTDEDAKWGAEVLLSWINNRDSEGRLRLLPSLTSLTVRRYEGLTIGSFLLRQGRPVALPSLQHLDLFCFGGLSGDDVDDLLTAAISLKSLTLGSLPTSQRKALAEVINRGGLPSLKKLDIPGAKTKYGDEEAERACEWLVDAFTSRGTAAKLTDLRLADASEEEVRLWASALQDWHNFAPALRQIAFNGKCEVYKYQRKAINEAEEQMRRRRGELHPTSRFIRKELRVMPLDQWEAHVCLSIERLAKPARGLFRDSDDEEASGDVVIRAGYFKANLAEIYHEAMTGECARHGVPLLSMPSALLEKLAQNGENKDDEESARCSRSYASSNDEDSGADD